MTHRCKPADWQDQPAKNGWIKTVCRTCGRFIGNRPVNLQRHESKTLDLEQNDEQEESDD